MATSGKVKTIIRCPKGTARREVPLAEVQVPDLWHTGQWLKEQGCPKAGEAVLECWGLAHDLLANLRGEV